ncbi:MAG: LysR family transcriptional regulator [Pseudomonadota bacterium]
MRQTIEIRDMRLLVALARHRHFAKAAEACGISQPAFSMRIRHLEEVLGLPIVRRGNRFLGFTEQGEMLLRRAGAVLDEMRALEQELSTVGGQISGALTLGVVPTALAFAAELCARLRDVHPGIRPRVVSAAAKEIQQGIEAASLDAGITYRDGISADLWDVQTLYEEEYVLVAPPNLIPDGVEEIAWHAAAALPLCLLVPEMQNRRILDRMFEEVGLRPRILAEANGFTSLLVMARQGMAATIVPAAMTRALGPLDGLRALPLAAPRLATAISLVAPRKTPGLPVVAALRRVAAS